MRPWTKLEKRNVGLAVFVTLFFIVLDQLVKVLAYDKLRGTRGYSFLGNFIALEYAENRGAFLSLGATLSESARFWVFVFGVVLILGFCVYTLWKTIHHTPSVVALALVISGGIGNLIDRIAQGYVIDYVHMGFAGLRTGVFNVADVAISGGLILLVFLQYSGSAELSRGAEKA